MHGLFGPIDQVDLADIRSFLADAGEESLTWEAKADDDRRQRAAGEGPGELGAQTIRKAVCGFGNAIGGYLVIGARSEKKTGMWQLPGVQISDPEPEGYLRRIIDSGVRPTPRYWPRTWRLDDGHIVALIEIEPVAQPPCMTNQGHVYERVSGETRRVSDPALLDALFRRGKQATLDAEAIADRATKSAMEYVSDNERAVGISLAVAPIAKEPDVSSRLFAPSFDPVMREALARFMGASPPAENELRGRDVVMAQDRVAALAAEMELDEPEDRWHMSWIVEALWDGSACAHVSLSPDRTIAFSAIESVVIPGWRECVDLVARLGGYGPARLAVRVRVGNPDSGHLMIHVPGHHPPEPMSGSFFEQLPADSYTVMTREIELAAPTDEQIGSLHRELQRAAGVTSYEPEIDGGDG